MTLFKKEYKTQLNTYSFPYTKELTKKYLESYWLYKKELNNFWIPIKNKMFNPDFKWFPDLVFKNGYVIYPMIGFCILGEEYYNKLKKCMIKCGDKEFVILEGFSDEITPPLYPEYSEPPLRFKYASTLAWNKIDWSDHDISKGEGISYELFLSPVRNYYIFGDSGIWGQYSANDYDMPIEILIFKPKHASIFKEAFKQSDEEMERVKKWLPDSYIEFIA